MIKGVILSELCYGSSRSYLDSIPDVAFLTQKPDLEITYNEQMLNEISFSLEPNPGQKYDFISLVLRDLLKGLGLTSSYRSDPATRGLQNPSQKMTPFESFINETLGNYDNPFARMSNATRGYLTLKTLSREQLKLYAPNIWQNGVSLNYFIPQDDSSVSQILSYMFCKGMVTRSLDDDYSQWIFRELLGWKPNFATSSSTPSSSVGGSTSLLMPYNGSLTINENNTFKLVYANLTGPLSISKQVRMNDNDDVNQYVEAFHPFLMEDGTYVDEGISISVLKRDGNWDLVQFIPFYIPEMTYNMSDWIFHYDADEYARTVDGYLRARITSKTRDNSRRIIYSSTFAVIDYLPQKVKLSYAFVSPDMTQSIGKSAEAASADNNQVRIYFSNLEGVNRIVLERLREGFRVPSKIEVTDFKKGYYDTTIDCTTTFTAVGYNDNGSSRGLPIKITLASGNLDIRFRLADNTIHINSVDNADGSYDYTIIPLGAEVSQSNRVGHTVDNVDISTLPEGLYILNVTDTKSGISKSLKFKK